MSFFPSIKKIKSELKKHLYNYRKSSQTQPTTKKNIIFVLPVLKHSVGGAKVTFRQCQLISEMQIKGFTSQILHPQKPKFKPDWFNHQAQLKQDLVLDPNRDFVVIPEIWAVPHAKKLSDIGVKYAIYVQNGYGITVPVQVYGYTEEALKQAYANASLVMSISDDTTECIKLTFPNLKADVIRMVYSVDAEKFKPSTEKENLITYMPRKLASHSKMVVFILKQLLPAHWKIQAIQGLNEEGVSELLSRSKIFLSFSEFEGCPLPPVEAALSGNQVIGYTGEGAKEYWDFPMFTEVFCGDIRNFVQQILHKMRQLDESPKIEALAIKSLAERYSLDAEKRSLQQLINSIRLVSQ